VDSGATSHTSVMIKAYYLTSLRRLTCHKFS